ncbi:retrograde regulation protein 2 [Thozetella sp. PMI_491]|nr:retrograde regulation protein 2 [Thozetella sp. PMI_491]
MEGEVITSATKGGFTAEEVARALAEYQPGSKAEKRMLLKVDLFLLPTLWIMCVICYMDRNNIGNANAAGMSKDLHLSDTQYSLLISLFFVGYVLWEVPSNIILSRTRPAFYLPGLMVAWGTLVCGMSQVNDFKDILICRFFLGVIEAGFFPGVLYIMSCWYKKNEIGKRFCFFFTALCFAGAASGLISGAVISGLDGARGMTGWRWLFLVEGIVTISWAIVSIFLLFNYPDTKSRRLNDQERLLAIVRIMHDKGDVASARKRRRLTPLESVKAALVDLRTYFFIILYMTQNGSTTVSYFIPTVLNSMGYTGVSAQWMTVPIWAVGTVFLLVFPQTADRYNDRRWHIVGGLMTGFISAVVSVCVPHNQQVRYAFMCFYIAGLYMTLPLILNWASELMALPAEKRAVVIALTNCVGSISSIYGSFLWPSTDAPEYKKGFTVVSIFLGFGVCLAAGLPIIFRHLPTFTTKAERELAAEMQRERAETRGSDGTE